ncbi:hypothetical protein AMTRI_Chr10g2900 [Amborella trichopoda]
MTVPRTARAAGSFRMRNLAGNDTPVDAIIIADDEPPMAMVEEDLGHAFNISLDEPSSSSWPPRSGFTRRGIVLEQLRIPFSTHVEGLDYLSADIGADHRLIGRSSLDELIQLPNLLERTAANLTAFGVPEASKLKKIIGELTQEKGNILKLERLISQTQPSTFGYTKGLLAKLKSDLTYREGFHTTIEAHSLKEGEDVALGGISLHDNEAGMIVLRRHSVETETLLSWVCKEMGDLSLSYLKSGSFPLLARHASSLKVAELKDRLGIRQRVFIEIGAHKE